ncbi:MULTISPECIES: hydantoinase/oxoprolinase family protein [unclassified Desulfobacter]|uniref:hydantoinase/oxoprolinase family protein n=1 Tax=unclassified Desulfobacter TaxID=2634406 RepID=UPI000E8A3304|nr:MULTISPECIES: hydantoinase/oxoprolinase family protein [unclassified Desulfobacter]MBP8828527.1 hydantoinase/oxoprolinase family protein [Desulfobacter sp.]HBT87838.1 hydantoinase [Desulfobacter sp.]
MILGLDVGGTNTDVVFLSPKGVQKYVKVPTQPDNLFKSVLSGFTLILEDVDPGLVERVVISTTLTTNAIVQQTVTPVGIIVSAGPGIDPENFRTGDQYYAVGGSINHRGREIEPINEAEIQIVGEKLKKAGIEYVGVVGKFCVRNPSHEILIKRILDKQFKQIFLGHHVSGNLNFPRRIATTYMNAAVYPLHKDFFQAVEQSLEEMGLTVPIQILKADGGTMTLAASMDFPAQTVLSGPAASIMGAIPYAPEGQDAVVLDIGGTTTDIAFLVDKTPLLEPVGIQRGGYKSLIRSLRTVSEGIGGDSALRINDKNKLTVGPDRMGPAMAFGGSVPTPTDALVVLGLMDSGDQDRARQGIKSIAGQLGMEEKEAAEHIFKICCNIILKKTFEMIDTLNSKPVYTVHDFLEGYKFSPDTILLMGGPARFFAEKIQDMYQLETIAVPYASVANAIGAALARTTCEVTVNADTEQGVVTAHEEDFAEPVSKSFSKDDLVETAYSLLKDKAENAGADPDNLNEVEVVEFQEFNIVRNFSPRGKIFRMKIQLKPGLIHGYESMLNPQAL